MLAAAGKVIGGKPGLFQAPSSNSQGSSAKRTNAPQFLQKLTSINARQGENVTFVAEFDGEPAPTVQWQFNGRQLQSVENFKVSHRRNLFFI